MRCNSVSLPKIMAQKRNMRMVNLYYVDVVNYCFNLLQHKTRVTVVY